MNYLPKYTSRAYTGICFGRERFLRNTTTQHIFKVRIGKYIGNILENIFEIRLSQEHIPYRCGSRTKEESI